MSQPMPISCVNSKSEETVLVVQTPCILGCKRKMPIAKPPMSISVPSILGCKRKKPIRNNKQDENIKRLEEENERLKKYYERLKKYYEQLEKGNERLKEGNERLKTEILEKERILYEKSNCE